jgi:membrane protein DedA with SNARE-associated domain
MAIIQILLPYLALCAGILLEGESFLLAASVSAHFGYMNIYIIIMLTIICTQISDWFWFLTGRKKGMNFIQKKSKILKKIEFIYKFIDTFPFQVMFLYRFVYGIRSIMPLVLGTSRVKTKHFFIFGLSSTLIWSCMFATFGYYFGSEIQAHIQLVKQYEYSIIASIIIALVAIIYFTKIYKRRKKARLDNPSVY